MENTKIRKQPMAGTELMTYGKLPPQSTELEKAILGAIMLEPSATATLFSIIQEPEVFYLDSHQRIFNAIKTLYNASKKIDFIVVCEQLKKQGDLEAVGGAYYVTMLTQDVVSSAHIGEHASIVKEKYITRELIRTSSECIKSGFDETTDVFELLDTTIENLISLNDNISKNKLRHIADVGRTALDAMYEAKINPEMQTGIQTGIHAIDSMIGGINAPDVTIISAPPGEGKSTLALNIAKNVMDQGHGVLFFSLEMKAEQLMWKVFSQITGEPISKIRKGELTEAHWEMLTEAQATFSHANMYFHDTGSLDTTTLRSIVNAHKAKHPISLVVIDYVQLMEATNGVKYGTREQEVSKISRDIKRFAMANELPVIELVQMSRQTDLKPRLPRNSDLRESGGLENNADNIIFIFNPATQGVTSVSNGDTIINFHQNEVLICATKCRLGEKGTKMCKFFGKSQTFANIEDVRFEHHGFATGLNEEENAPF